MLRFILPGMPALDPEPRLTPRDLDILTALDHCPLTALQLLTFSQTFATPFTTERRVRERLHQLCAAGRVRRWQYATAGQGAPNYYTLSLLGYRLLHGDEARPPTKRYFDPVAIARQHHTSSLADFIVHTATSAHRLDIPMTGFCRENTIAIHSGDDVIYPDCAFLLVPPGRSELRFFVELDNSTERLRSTTDSDNWQRKLSIYEARADAMPDRRFRLLVITTRSRGRLDNILRLAAESSRNAYRSLVYGVHLPAYLAQTEGVSARCFTDHRGRAVSLALPSK
jgi:hypothetical protein